MARRVELHGEPDPSGFRPRILPPIGAAIAAVAAYGLVAALDRADIAQVSADTADTLRWVGIAVLVASTGLSTWAAWGFVSRETPLEPGYVATTMITDGPFRFSRNPIYLGMALGLVGWALFLEQPVAIVVALAFAVVLQWRIIRHEERMLTQTFGEEYAAYRARVRRWI